MLRPPAIVSFTLALFAILSIRIALTTSEPRLAIGSWVVALVLAIACIWNARAAR
jgi:hypothetical protein